MVFKNPPKGYESSDYPLPHNFLYQGGLGLDGTSKNATYFPLIVGDKGLVNSDLVNANPEHGSFAEATTPYCYKNSTVPRMMVSFSATLSKVAIETDKLQVVKGFWFPVYTAFKNRLDAEDQKSGNTTAEILEIESEAVGKSVYPLWSAVNMSGPSTVGIHANATTPLMGLTTDALWETVDFSSGLLYDALHYYQNRNMLKKMIGPIRKFGLTRDRNYRYYSNNLTNSIVKRINDYTFCGIMISVNKSGAIDQYPTATETTDINHVNLNCVVRYDEWNSEFDQTAT